MCDARYIPLRHAAGRLGLPVAYLRREAEAGSIPALRCDRRWFVDWLATEAAIRERAAQQPQEAAP